ncbi:Saposin B-type domain-containing protein [Mycena venus]|uniref:Saposin B-type domain-containing protein n=1 Tax=Mycena venus TaxID=2733690 RepID=A0A8H6XP91_9AGAR|nr:Saposin B-type domain-containing protein [Mycena venus]
MSGLPPLDGILGNAEIGVALAAFLFAIETLQTYDCYRDYPRDQLALKTLESPLPAWCSSSFSTKFRLLELGTIICSWHGVGRDVPPSILIFELQELPIVPLSLVMGILIQEIIKFCVQSFFTFHVQVLSKRWMIPILAFILTTVRLGFNAALVAVLFKTPEFTVVTLHLRWMMITISGIGPVVDISVAVSLCYFFWRSKGKSGFQRTSRMLDSLIIWTVETTALTVLSGALELIFFLAKEDLTWLIFYFIQAKVLGNSMVASLNGQHRQEHRFRSGEPLQPHVLGFDSTQPSLRDTSLVVRMQHFTATDIDDIRPNPKVISSCIEEKM